MGAVDEIRRAGVELRPPLAESAIGELAEEVGAPLPAELRELLGVTAGTDEPVELDFTGQSLSFGDEDIFPACHPFAGDGSGNHWVLDLTSASTERAAVFFACHDPPVVVYEAPDLAHFLRDVLARGALADDAHAQRGSRCRTRRRRPPTTSCGRSQPRWTSGSSSSTCATRSAATASRGAGTGRGRSSAATATRASSPTRRRRRSAGC
jgi:hypothetical protein